MSEGDTKELVPLPLEENREQPAKSPRERIDSAVAKVVEEFLIVRETSANELAEVTQIIEDDWEIFTTLFDMAAVRDFDARKVKSSFDLFLIESASVGLNIIQVDRTDMPNPELVESLSNVAQLDIVTDTRTNTPTWILKLDREKTQDYINTGNALLGNELAHDYFAWRLFTKVGDIPSPEHKDERNKVIMTEKNPLFQTHFFDLVFDKIVDEIST